MTKLSTIALATLLAIGGATAPALAATGMGLPAAGGVNVPWCNTGTDTDFTKQMSTLSDQLQLSTKQGVSIDKSNGCIAVTASVDGRSSTSYYDPESLRLLATM